MNYIVIEKYETEFINPIILKTGEKVTIGEDPNPEMNSATWVNWVYCIKEDGSNAGFVPEQIIRKEGEYGTILQNYSAKELSVEKGEIIKGIEELNGWLWSKIESTGEIGWIPMDNLKLLD
jgi:hypothetical protein